MPACVLPFGYRAVTTRQRACPTTANLHDAAACRADPKTTPNRWFQRQPCRGVPITHLTAASSPAPCSSSPISAGGGGMVSRRCRQPGGTCGAALPRLATVGRPGGRTGGLLAAVAAGGREGGTFLPALAHLGRVVVYFFLGSVTVLFMSSVALSWGGVMGWDSCVINGCARVTTADAILWCGVTLTLRWATFW